MLKFLAIILLVVLLVSGCASSTTGPGAPVSQPAPAPAPGSPSTPAEPPPPVLSSPTPPVVAPTPAPTPPEGNGIGNLAFDFQLNNLEGKTVSLSGLRGQPVLLNFWATWCPPCKAEMPFLQQINDSYSNKGLVVLEIDIGESADTVIQFLHENNLTLQVLLDTDKKVALAYGIAAIPTTYLIDKNGIIRQRVIGAFPDKTTIESQLSKILP